MSGGCPWSPVIECLPHRQQIEPSEYAKELYELAKDLVSLRKYKDALDLMLEGEKKDPTVAAYKEFMKRIGEVVGIEVL